MPAWRVRVMPVSGAQHAWLQEMLQAAVHSMYIRAGAGRRRRRAAGCSSSPAAVSADSRRRTPTAAVQVGAERPDVRAGPHAFDGRLARIAQDALCVRIGHPQTMRPSQSMTSMSRATALEPRGQEVQGHDLCFHSIPAAEPARDS